MIQRFGRHVTHIVISGTALLLASAPLAAQQLGWSGSVEASGNLLFGNAGDRLIAGRLQLGRADSTLEVRSDARLTYTEAADDAGKRRVTGRTSLASLALDYAPFFRYSPFWFGSIESSLQQRIARRFSTGVGTKLTFYRRKEDDASVSVALLAENTRALRTDDPAGVDSAESSWRGRWSFRGRVRQNLNETVRFTHTTFYQPSASRIDQYTVTSTSTLAANLTSKVAMTFTFQDTYDSQARERGARKNNDGQVLFGVRAAF